MIKKIVELQKLCITYYSNRQYRHEAAVVSREHRMKIVDNCYIWERTSHFCYHYYCSIIFLVSYHMTGVSLLRHIHHICLSMLIHCLHDANTPHFTLQCTSVSPTCSIVSRRCITGLHQNGVAISSNDLHNFEMLGKKRTDLTDAHNMTISKPKLCNAGPCLSCIDSHILCEKRYTSLIVYLLISGPPI